MGSSKAYAYTAQQGAKKVGTLLRFVNSKDNNLGLALPKGIVRIYQVDKDDNQLEFIGEDRVDHTPKDEEVELKIGNS